jgi:hypothetical protein
MEILFKVIKGKNVPRTFIISKIQQIKETRDYLDLEKE